MTKCDMIFNDKMAHKHVVTYVKHFHLKTMQMMQHAIYLLNLYHDEIATQFLTRQTPEFLE